MGEGLPRGLTVSPGAPSPRGFSRTDSGVNFSLYSRVSSRAFLVLWVDEERIQVELDPGQHRTDRVWHVELGGLELPVRYAWSLGQGEDAGPLVVDPWARSLVGGESWGHDPSTESLPGRPRRLGLVPEESGLSASAEPEEIERPTRLPTDRVIYELHIRGFTRHASSSVPDRGTYRGLLGKIPYLQQLGVTTVELLPLFDFDETWAPRRSPVTGAPLLNLWGYSPISFFAPKAGYASADGPGQEVLELKNLVRELHQANLEVIVDVVYNHTGEGEGRITDPTYSFRGIDEQTYYMVDPATGGHRDFTGCGNTVRCQHPEVADLILASLRYWRNEIGVDGFRFDLASVLTRGEDGEPQSDPELIRRIGSDPDLQGTILVAEAWDAGGLYQLGQFPRWGPWAEWNGLFRDDVRRFLRGDPGMASRMASRLGGSSDLYTSPEHSINFITCHDGFTLEDLVSYTRKRNEANGEGNRDGTDNNHSWNCGREGPTTNPRVLELRRRQVRNFLTVLFLSQGTPLLLAGDELGRTQGGNNNAYCQDNDISWVDWRLEDKNQDLHRFVRLLVAFRKARPGLRRKIFFQGRGTAENAQPDVAWYSRRLNVSPWGPRSRELAMHVSGAHAPEPDVDIYMAANPTRDDVVFQLPDPPEGSGWVRVIDTARPSPHDIEPEGQEPEVGDGGELGVSAHSIVVLRSAG